MLLHEMLDRNVRSYPFEEALVCDDRSYSYQDFGEGANWVTNFLLNLGVKKADRVALLARNSAQYMMLYSGIFRCGAVAVPVNFRLSAGEVAYIVNQSDATDFVFERKFLDLVLKIKPQLEGVRHFIMMGEGELPEGILSYEGLMFDASSEESTCEIQESDVAVQMYTSGTTGFPKGAMLTHRNLLAGSHIGILSMEINSAGRTLIVAPLFHIASAVLALTTVLIGGTIVIMDQFEPEQVLNAMEKEKISHTVFVPAMLRMLVEFPGVKKYDFSSLKTIAFGAAPMDMKLLQKCLKVFQCGFMHSFGQTEASPGITSMSREEIKRIENDPENLNYLLNSVGKEVPGVHVRVVDDQDRDVDQGEVGEVIARGDNVMSGYYKMEQETRETLKGGWLHTGDLGKFDEQRYLYIIDRKKDMIISGGENIYCPEIENVILQVTGITETAVVGIPDEKWGEVPKAFVVRTANAEISEDDILSFCKNHLAAFKCPREVTFVKALPRNSAGKVLKRLLKESL